MTFFSSECNPRYYHCYADEDFVGRLGKIAARAHPRSMSGSAISRHSICVHARISSDRG